MHNRIIKCYDVQQWCALHNRSIKSCSDFFVNCYLWIIHTYYNLYYCWCVVVEYIPWTQWFLNMNMFLPTSIQVAGKIDDLCQKLFPAMKYMLSSILKYSGENCWNENFVPIPENRLAAYKLMQPATSAFFLHHSNNVHFQQVTYFCQQRNWNQILRGE